MNGEQAGKVNEPCRTCSSPIGPKGIWFPNPMWIEKPGDEPPPYGLCPPCHQAVWDSWLDKATKKETGDAAVPSS